MATANQLSDVFSGLYWLSVVSARSMVSRSLRAMCRIQFLKLPALGSKTSDIVPSKRNNPKTHRRARQHMCENLRSRDHCKKNFVPAPVVCCGAQQIYES